MAQHPTFWNWDGATWVHKVVWSDLCRVTKVTAKKGFETTIVNAGSVTNTFELMVCLSQLLIMQNFLERLLQMVT
jgi:hypothetical protein